jgi:hypothetical protein
MYIINDSYFQSNSRAIPNLDEADSKNFANLELLIDENCRLLLRMFLTKAEITELESYLIDGIFPVVTTGIPQKWIDLVNGKGNWKGLVYSLGTAKQSLLADYVYYFFLVDEVSYMAGVGDVKALTKGAMGVNPTQRIVRIWNEFVREYQGANDYFYSLNRGLLGFLDDEFENDSLLKFIYDNPIYLNRNPKIFEFQNQIGI